MRKEVRIDPREKPRARSVPISFVREPTAAYIVLSAPKTAPSAITSVTKSPSPRRSVASVADCAA